MTSRPVSCLGGSSSSIGSWLHGVGFEFWGWHFVCVGRLSKPFQREGTGTNLRMTWLYKNCPDGGILAHFLYLFSLKRRERGAGGILRELVQNYKLSSEK